MKIEKVKLTQVKVNNENPRTITSEKFSKLVNSILVLPKMLEIRPVVVDNTMKALGGNMRLNALKEIAKMSPDGLAHRLASTKDYQRKSEGEKSVLVEHWGKWLGAPYAYIIRADELSEDERKQFIIKDNVSFGQWDYDKLGNQWDNSRLNDWGMDIWDASPAAFTPLGTTPSQSAYNATEPDADEIDHDRAIDDAISGIVEKSFAGAISSEVEYFAMTFIFKKEDEDVVNKYIKERGKQEVVDMIIAKAEVYAASAQ